ncbi:hypothetical protein BCR43DRAFT_491486 [Syncephalastrum racemosum]|uniref:SNARE-complex protein Syntaxin-18 N-terminal domain-containing protein n=1 Tax=Syncephalastrum racemosum TaxID=13706 RepID=A0A1X2HBY5_SYNRA|nr:hypothetical protein BCR43DRAFT_491486 [Syncephalastrum racemosum]
MPNRTHDFRQLAAQAPPSPPHNRKPNRKEKDPFTREAYRISAHVTDLKRFLSTVRRAYLATEKHHRRSPPPPLEQQKPHDESSLFALFDNVSYLTDPERDEIDYQAKVIIQRCLDSIRELEHVEKIRLEQPKPRHRLAGLLSAVLHESNHEREDVLALHRSSILWLLNKRLTEASQLQKSQQETRLTREIEKSENQLFRSSAIHTKMEPTPPPQEDQEDPFPTLDLSDNQLQMLEHENATMIEELNSTLTQVRSAEQALLEISTLQTQLMSHLNAQTVQTDRLYADSVATRERVEQGNLQLIQTRERNRGTRKFMFIFLFGASLVLLFLDWYS